jgi:hypothetical protein
MKNSDDYRPTLWGRIKFEVWLPIRRWATPVRCIGLLILVAGVIGGWASYPTVHPEGFHLTTFLTDFYANTSTELVSIAITVLVLDTINENRAKRERKRAIIEQLGSHSNDFALDAARIIENEEWLEDGSLRGASLFRASLQGAHLWQADLQGAHLLSANLQEADLFNANLQWADLFQANLEGANLLETNLEGASLQEANLKGARVNGGTILPDGTKWTPDTDITRFTDPEHPEFWRSDDPRSPSTWL